MKTAPILLVFLFLQTLITLTTGSKYPGSDQSVFFLNQVFRIHSASFS